MVLVVVKNYENTKYRVFLLGLINALLLQLLTLKKNHAIKNLRGGISTRSQITSSKVSFPLLKNCPHFGPPRTGTHHMKTTLN